MELSIDDENVLCLCVHMWQVLANPDTITVSPLIQLIEVYYLTLEILQLLANQILHMLLAS